jgi:hypothetical protein
VSYGTAKSSRPTQSQCVLSRSSVRTQTLVPVVSSVVNSTLFPLTVILLFFHSLDVSSTVQNRLSLFSFP